MGTETVCVNGPLGHWTKHAQSKENMTSNIYSVYSQVCSVLESLEREYRREEDWCSTEKANNSDKVTYMSQLLTKHQEQKEAFLKVSTIALTKQQEQMEAFLKVSTIALTK